jgi:hypothetical protein
MSWKNTQISQNISIILQGPLCDLTEEFRGRFFKQRIVELHMINYKMSCSKNLFFFNGQAFIVSEVQLGNFSLLKPASEWFQVCQICRCYNIPKLEKYTYQITRRYTKSPDDVANGRKIYQLGIQYRYQHFPLQDPPKFTQIWIFGLKIYHLATQVCM